MWPGAVMAERTRRYRWIVLVTGGGPGRVLILAMVALPWMASDNAALGVLLAVSLGRAFLGNVAMPAWSAFGAEFVPLGLRGRYFGSRNFARQVAGLMVAPLAGLLIERIGGVEGWQLAWIVAFILGATATGFYARIPEEAADPRLRATQSEEEAHAEPRAFLKDRNLMWLTGTVGLFHTSVMLAGPFFSVYLVRHLGASPLWVGITAAAVPVGGLLAQPLVGQLNDRLGAKWLLVVSGFLLPGLPWFWAIVTEPWQVIFINLAAGAFWAAHQLGTFNLTLAIAPPEKRATYSAVQQGAVFVAGAIGPLIGGPVIGLAGYKLIFLLSGAGRVVATALLMRTVRDHAARSSRGSASPD
jgi:MFS family permease